MEGYRVSQFSATQAAQAGFEVFHSQLFGFYLRSDNVKYSQIQGFLRSPFEMRTIPTGAVKAIIGVDLAPKGE